MKMKGLFVVTAAAVGGLILSSRSDASSGRMPAPEGRMPPPPPPRAGEEASDAPTIMMMRSQEPPAASQGSWSRLVAENHNAVRSEARNPNTGNTFPIPPSILFGGQQLDLDRGGWVSVRLWAETQYSPVREESRPAFSYWSWIGQVSPGRVLTPIMKNVGVFGTAPGGGALPAASWIAAGARINAAGKLEVSWRYPGKENTGVERGRDYDIVLEWTVTPNKPL